MDTFITENELKKFGFTLRQIREDKKMTREYIADRIDVNFRTLGKWENGQADPPLSKVLHIAKTLGEPIEKLLGLETAKVRDSFNNNQQEGETCILNSGVIALDREAMKDIHNRFLFLEQVILSLQEEKQGLLKALQAKIEASS